MEDEEFVTRMQKRIATGAGMAVEVALDAEHEGDVVMEMDRPVPRVVMGADALRYPGLARMYMQYAILCLREQRKVTEQEFFLFLRRN